MIAHESIDRRGLEMDRAIALKLRDNPESLNRARSILERWLSSADSQNRPSLEEWRLILEKPLDEIIEVLTGVDERSIRLRQSSPFCGFLTTTERTKILMENLYDPRAT
jgi:hypothetical protein